MSKPTFLSQLAQEVLKSNSNTLSGLTIVLPNKRAKVFLLEELKLLVHNNVFAPEIISIEEFIQEISGIRSVDSVELLFEFYEVYLAITDKDKQESFENFANWAKTLLQDFNEIDRYLLEPNKILKYLEDIKEIEHWSVDVDKRTNLIEKHMLFWKNIKVFLYE